MVEGGKLRIGAEVEVAIFPGSGANAGDVISRAYPDEA